MWGRYLNLQPLTEGAKVNIPTGNWHKPSTKRSEVRIHLPPNIIELKKLIEGIDSQSLS